MSTNLPVPIPLNYPEDPGSSRFRLMLNGLAREIVMGLEEVSSILTRKGITNTQYEKILKNPYYIRIFAEFSAAWNDASNAEQRNRVQAQYLIEQAMPAYFVRVINEREPLPAVTEGMKFLARVAGFGETRPGPEGGKFVISINLGHGQTIEHEVKTIEGTPQAEEGLGHGNSTQEITPKR